MAPGTRSDREEGRSKGRREGRARGQALMGIKHPPKSTRKTFHQPENLVLAENIRFVFTLVPMETSGKNADVFINLEYRDRMCV